MDLRAAGKQCCVRSTRPQAVLAVGLRQKALQQRFLIATTAYRRFPQPADIRVDPCDQRKRP
jgi:hypothetical protein